MTAIQNMFFYMQDNPDHLAKTIDEGVNKVLNSNGKYAFILESPMNDYHVSQNCLLMRVGEMLDSKHYAIAFPKGKYFLTIF